jgi:hypothetical protein
MFLPPEYTTLHLTTRFTVTAVTACISAQEVTVGITLRLDKKTELIRMVSYVTKVHTGNSVEGGEHFWIGFASEACQACQRSRFRVFYEWFWVQC